MLMEKIGTGEGQQAFGWGIYSAQNKEVGEKYRIGLSGRSYYDGERRLSKEEGEAAQQIL